MGVEATMAPEVLTGLSVAISMTVTVTAHSLVTQANEAPLEGWRREKKEGEEASSPQTLQFSVRVRSKFLNATNSPLEKVPADSACRRRRASQNSIVCHPGAQFALCSKNMVPFWALPSVTRVTQVFSFPSYIRQQASFVAEGKTAKLKRVATSAQASFRRSYRASHAEQKSLPLAGHTIKRRDSFPRWKR